MSNGRLWSGLKKWGSWSTVFLLFFICGSLKPSFCDTTPATSNSISLFEKSEKVDGKDFRIPYQLSYWPVIPGTERIYVDGVLKTRDADYTIDYRLGQLFMKEEIAQDSVIRIDYHIIPVSVQKSYQRQLFVPQEEKKVEEQRIYTEKKMPVEEIPSTLNFSGTKTLSLSMESLRGLTINQPTRLNISGKVSENINVTALLSDEDLPLQPEGTTEEIEDLNRVLIKIEGKHLSATLGDYETAFGETEFVLLPKMLEGAQAQGEFDAGGFTLLGAVSKGKSASVTFSGVEGRNEYRISMDGKYIIMIAGSETVWLNGEKMRREKDYVIRDYGDPIIEFTNKHMITGKDVILVDFEYIEEDRNYKQNLYGTRGKVNLRHSRFTHDASLITVGASYAIESDDRDNPMISLTSEDLINLRRNDLDPDGDGILLPAPAKRSVIGFDGRLNLGDRTHLSGELALSKRDLNTFSPYDKSEEGKAWKMIGSSSTDNFHINFDLRKLDPNFVPIGATLSSRNRSIYQRDYDNVTFGDLPPKAQAKPSGETSYNMDLWYEPVEHIELGGNMGRISNEYADAPKSADNHWSRSLRITLPDLPQINTRYQEVVTEANSKDDFRKTRESWELEHRFMGKLDVKARSEEMESLNLGYGSEDSKRRYERKISVSAPAFGKISLSGDYSYETEYSPDWTIKSSQRWSKALSAHTATLNIFAKPKSWLDFSGYFGHRKLSKEKNVYNEESPSHLTTNIADLKLNLLQLRINYQIDKKLSTEKEEQYVNYIITMVDGEEEKRFLRPGEGSYVKIDEYTYREDLEKGDYIRLIRTVGDRPVASLALQSVYSLRPRSLRRSTTGPASPSVMDQLLRAISVLEIGARINEEQEDASRGFYLLKELQTDKTIYGLRKYWCRTQISPIRHFLLTGNWETGKTLNKRLNNRSRKLRSDIWDIKLESPLATNLSLGGEWEKDSSLETTTDLPLSGTLSLPKAISDISERQQSWSLFLRYHPVKAVSRLELKGTYEQEWNDDVLNDDPPVLTRTISLGSEAMLSFRGKGTTIIKYEIARGTSSGELPFARYDFHKGISHKVRLETSYRLKWLTDLTIRTTYRAEIAEDIKPDHRLEMEATASL